MDSFDDAAEKYRSFCSRLSWWRVGEFGREENPGEEVFISLALSVRSRSHRCSHLVVYEVSPTSGTWREVKPLPQGGKLIPQLLASYFSHGAAET